MVLEESTPRITGSSGQPKLPRQLASLLRLRYDYTRNTEDLEQACTILQDLLDVSSPEDETYVEIQVMFCVNRCHLAKTPEGLQLAIMAAKKAVEYFDGADINLPGHLTNIPLLYKSLYHLTSNTSALEEGICWTERALAHFKDTNDAEKDNHAAAFENLATLLTLKHEATNDLELLDCAIAKTKESLRIATDDNPRQGLIYGNPGHRLFTKATKTQSLSVARRAIGACSTAISLTPEAHPDRARRSYIFSFILIDHYTRSLSYHRAIVCRGEI